MDTILIVRQQDSNEGSILFNFLSDEGVCLNCVSELGIESRCVMCCFDQFYETACKYQPKVIFIFDSENIYAIMRASIRFQKEPFPFRPKIVLFGKEQKVSRIIKNWYERRSLSRAPLITLYCRSLNFFVALFPYIRRNLFEDASQN
jgi:hypothetical protein